MGVLDKETIGHTGDPILLDTIARVNPQYVVFGHVHGTYGCRRWKKENIQIWNQKSHFTPRLPLESGTTTTVLDLICSCTFVQHNIHVNAYIFLYVHSC